MAFTNGDGAHVEIENQRDGVCPYTNVGYCDVPYQQGGLMKCYTSTETAQSCRDNRTASTGIGFTCYNPIATYRKVLQ